MGPGVAVEKRNIPLDVGSEFGVVGCFGTTETAVANVEIEGRMIGHSAKDGGHVLNRVGRNGEHAVPAFRHGCTQNTGTARLIERKVVNA